jgi:hypothetical protein
METVIRDVRDLDTNARSALEKLVGHQLGESQRLVIQVMNMAIPAENNASGPTDGVLPEWCRVFEGLSPEQVEDIDRSIVRSHASRDIA